MFNYLPMYHVCALPLEGRRGHQITGTGIADGCKVPRGCWELNPGPLQRQPVLLEC